MKLLNESCHKKINRIHVSTAAARALLYYAQWTGHFVCRRDFCIERSGFRSYLLLYTVRGEGQLSYRGERHRLPAGCAMLIDCCEHHRYHPIDDGWEFKYVHFAGADTVRLYEQITRHGPVIRDAPELEPLLDQLMRAVVDTDELALSALLYRMLMHLLAARGTVRRTPTQGFDAGAAMAYIASHYGQDLSVAHLSEVFHMSRTYFSTEFKRCTGYTPHEYLTRFRMSAAKRMLVSTNRSVGEIAERCGFRDTSSFIRAFRRAEGVPPHAYRRESTAESTAAPMGTVGEDSKKIPYGS